MNARNPEKKTGTILFCDIRNFTSLFDEKDPFDAVDFANTVLTDLGEAVEENGGTVDRFTGDGFLAHFGFQNETTNHAHKACEAVLAIRNTLMAINTKRYHKLETVVSVGVGIHTGEAAYCKIETRQFKQVTVLGDTVNVAARIQEMTKYFIVDVLVSDETYKHVKDIFLFKKMPLKNIKGKKTPVQTHWFLPANSN